MTWEVRAVTQDGTLVSVVEGVTVGRPHMGINGDTYVDVTIPTLHPDATHLDLFENEVQLWRLDGDDPVTVDGESLSVDGEPLTVTGPAFFDWFRPTRVVASKSGSSDTLTVRLESLFSYFHDVFVGGERPNHIVSPHLDAATVGTLPNSWQAVAAVEEHAVVDNNWEFWSHQKAIQVNNSVAGADAYIYQRYTVPSQFDGVPFAAAATCYISDNQAGSPPWGGPAHNERGLMIHRLDGSTFAPISGVRSAKITDDTPRNALVRLQTQELIPRTGDVIEVRLYAPDAWTAWRYVHLYDGRWEGSDGLGKADAITMLVAHAQDTALGKQDHNIGTDVTALGGETTNKTWPWWRRDNIGEQIIDLADTFEFTMDYPDLTPGAAVRNVKVRRTLGTDLS